MVRYLDHFFARRIRTFAFVTGSRTNVSAHLASRCAWLNTHLTGFFASPRMTERYTFVSAARDRFVAGQATRDFVHVARYGFSYFVLAVTPSLSQHGTWWTSWVIVTIVKNLVAARMLTRARTVASWPSRAARHRRINHRCTTLAVQLFETHFLTRLASACKTIINHPRRS